MTTIAYKDGIMAADSRCTSGGAVVGQYVKIVTLHGFILGGCGAIANICKFFDWFEEHHKGDKPTQPPEALIPKDGDAYCILFVHKATGQTWQLDNGGYPHKLGAPFMAIGSGSALAMGAMEMGADAVKAVRVAIKYDIYSGGKVNKLKV